MVLYQRLALRSGVGNCSDSSSAVTVLGHPGRAATTCVRNDGEARRPLARLKCEMMETSPRKELASGLVRPEAGPSVASPRIGTEGSRNRILCRAVKHGSLPCLLMALVDAGIWALPKTNVATQPIRSMHHTPE